MLDKIYTVEASYFLRKTANLFEFGRLNKLFERKIEHIEKYSPGYSGSASSPTSQKWGSTACWTTCQTSS